MTEENKDLPETGEERPQVTYASPMKRIWAWVGVVYMLMIVFLMTYMYAKGTYLTNIGPLMTVPALAGLGISALYVYRSSPKQKTAAHAVGLAVLLLACIGLIGAGLVVGIPALLKNFGG